MNMIAKKWKLLNIEDYKMKDIKIGGFYSITGITTNEEIMTIGWGDFGRRGNGGVQEDYSIIRIDNDSKIKQIECGGCHTIVLYNNGEVYGWGRNEIHELTMDRISRYGTPFLIIKDAKRISANVNYIAIERRDGIIIRGGNLENEYTIRNARLLGSTKFWENLYIFKNGKIYFYDLKRNIANNIDTIF